jgi:5-methylcytosine-specific restriction endonuclease McrA
VVFWAKGEMTRGDFLAEPDESALRRERQKARDLRVTQWWKNKRASGICHYCRGRFPARQLTMDHVVPLIRGGKSTKSNLVPCCRECNARKKNLLPTEWQEYLDDLAQRDATP